MTRSVVFIVFFAIVIGQLQAVPPSIFNYISNSLADGPMMNRGRHPISMKPVDRPSKNIPEYCSDRPDGGPCIRALVRYFFDSNTGECIPFIYGGCKGNNNNFKRKDQCMKTCALHDPTSSEVKSSTSVKVPSEDLSFCAYPPEAGPCRRFIYDAYYYDPRFGHCNMFYFGGCQGNKNNFPDYFMCQDACAAYGKRDADYNCTKDGDFPMPNAPKCSFYVNCSNGRGAYQACEAGMHFNNKTNQCDDACKVGCDPSIRPCLFRLQDDSANFSGPQRQPTL